MRLHAGESLRHYFVVVNAAGRIGQHPTSANTQRFDVPDCIAVAALSIGAMVRGVRCRIRRAGRQRRRSREQREFAIGVMGPRL